MKWMVVFMAFILLLPALFVAADGKYSESPMLKEQVANGELPPVDQRLPERPFVVGPDVLFPKEYLDFQVGKYGGTMRLAHIDWLNEGIFCMEPVMRPNNPDDTAGARPGIVSDLKISPDNKKFTFTIRKGIRWSDGQPLTTEDIRFLFQDVYSNPQSKVPWPQTLLTQGKPGEKPPTWQIVDKYTFTMAYDKPYGILGGMLGSWSFGHRSIFQPSAYLKQFHAKYAPLEQLKPMFKSNMTEWGDLFSTKVLSSWDMVIDPRCIGVPVLTAFRPKEFNQDHLLFERNPYFWMVDTAGNQLPYMDYVDAATLNDMEAVKMRVLSGNVDFALYPALREMSLYLENKDKGNFTILSCYTINNAPALTLNQDYGRGDPNSVWQKMLADTKTRQGFGEALGLAMNHEEMNKTLYFGRNGLPWTTPKEYDPEKAKQILDSIGMDKVDGEGFRLAPDGQRFELAITQTSFGGDPDLVVTADALKGYFEAVGIRTSVKTIQENLWNQLANQNKVMAVIVWSDEPMWPGGVSRDYEPNLKGVWAPLTYTYFTGLTTQGTTASIFSNFEESTGTKLEGFKPFPYMKQYWDIDMARNEFVPSSPEGKAAFARLMKWFGDNYIKIFPTEKSAAIRIVSNRLGNVPKGDKVLPWDRIDYSFEEIFIK